MIVDNYELLKNKMFKSCDNGETYFVLKVFVRKKDFKANGSLDIYKGLFGSHSERVIYSTSFSNYEEFERCYQLVKILCDNIPFSRAYINADMKDTKKTVVSLYNKVNEISKRLIMKGETDTGLHREITKISRSVTSLKECDADRKYNWVLLDVDCFGEDNSPDDWYKALKFKERLDEVEIDNIFYKTLNGCHILLSMKDAGKFKNPKGDFTQIYNEFVGNSFVDVKENSAALLYMNTEIKDQ